MARKGGGGGGGGGSGSSIKLDPLLIAWIVAEVLASCLHSVLTKKYTRRTRCYTLHKHWQKPSLIFISLGYFANYAQCILVILNALFATNRTGSWGFVVGLDVASVLPDICILSAITFTLYHRRADFARTLGLTKVPVIRYIVDWTPIVLVGIFVGVATALDATYMKGNLGVFQTAKMMYNVQQGVLMAAILWVCISVFMLRSAMKAQNTNDVIMSRLTTVVVPFLIIHFLDVLAQLIILRLNPPVTRQTWKISYLVHIIITNIAYFAIFFVFGKLIEEPGIWSLGGPGVVAVPGAGVGTTGGTAIDNGYGNAYAVGTGSTAAPTSHLNKPSLAEEEKPLTGPGSGYEYPYQAPYDPQQPHTQLPPYPTTPQPQYPNAYDPYSTQAQNAYGPPNSAYAYDPTNVQNPPLTAYNPYAQPAWHNN